MTAACAAVATAPVDLRLTHGGKLASCRVAYRVFGASDGPVVVVLGGISSDKRLRAEAGDGGRPGWWQAMVGTGLAIDVDRYRAIGIDYVGGVGETRPLPSPDRPIDTRDQARAVAAVLDHLGVNRIAAVVGASYGGMVALAFASLFPERVARVVIVSAAHRTHAMATALRSLQRRLVRLHRGGPLEREALAIARGIAMTTYRTPEEFRRRFAVEPRWVGRSSRFPVEDYLDHVGDRFARVFPARALLALSESIDLHALDPAAVTVPATLVAVPGDPLVPVWLMEELRDAMPCVTEFVLLTSIFGHDAFLKEPDRLGAIVTRALESNDV